MIVSLKRETADRNGALMRGQNVADPRWRDESVHRLTLIDCPLSNAFKIKELYIELKETIAGETSLDKSMVSLL